MKNILTSLMLMACLSLSAQTVEQAGVTYKMINGTEAEVAANQNTDIEGAVVIAETVNDHKVVAVADSAFYKCKKITSLQLPKSVVRMGMFATSHCFQLTKFIVANDNPAFAVEDGVLMSKDMTTIICCPAGKTGNYKTPAQVTKIAPAAFSTCKNLGKIEIGDGITEIADYTFQGCWSLADVVFSNNLETIGQYAFANTILQRIYFPKTLKSIGDYAFANNSIVEVNLKGTVPPVLGKDVFGVENIDEKWCMRLYVPRGYVQTYKKDNKWRYFLRVLDVYTSRWTV